MVNRSLAVALLCVLSQAAVTTPQTFRIKFTTVAGNSPDLC